MIRYEIVLANAAGTKLDVITKWVTLSYTKAVNDVGVLQLTLLGDYSKAYYLKLDARIMVYRDIGNGFYQDTESVYFIRNIIRTLSSTGEKLIKVTALSATQLLARRIVAYAAGEAETSKSGPADDIMKAIVRENLGSSATDANRDMSEFLTIASDFSNGPTVSKSFSRKNVLSVLQELSQATLTSGSPVYFDVVSNSLNTLTFNTYVGTRGTDRSYDGGSDNFVILSPDRKNIENITIEQDWTDEANFIYAGGQGTDTDRLVVSASASDQIFNSVLNRHEKFVINTLAGGASASTSLLHEANVALRENRPLKMYTGTILSIPGTLYGLHWNWGDRISAEYESTLYTCTIDTVSVSVSGRKETVFAKLRHQE